MIQSMTGYGKAVTQYGSKKITVEIKSLNSKSMDMSARIPQLYRSHELEIRAAVAAALERGKVDITVTVDNSEATNAQTINQQVLHSYIEQIRSVASLEGLELPGDWFPTLLRMPEVMSGSTTEELSDEEWTLVSQAVDQAIKAIMDYRTAEGAALEIKFREKITNIGALLQSVEPFEKERVAKIKERIRASLEETVGSAAVDTNRFEQEMIYYIEKLDINEEKQRLSNHLNYFISTIEEGHGQGKKLGFIAQEMGREINTLGSKSNQAEMQNIVVRMKDELEQIKEQVLNVM